MDQSMYEHTDSEMASEYNDMLTEVETNYPDGLPTIYEEEKNPNQDMSFEDIQSPTVAH